MTRNTTNRFLTLEEAPRGSPRAVYQASLPDGSLPGPPPAVDSVQKRTRVHSAHPDIVHMPQTAVDRSCSNSSGVPEHTFAQISPFRNIWQDRTRLLCTGENSGFPRGSAYQFL